MSFSFFYSTSRRVQHRNLKKSIWNLKKRYVFLHIQDPDPGSPGSDLLKCPDLDPKHCFVYMVKMEMINSSLFSCTKIRMKLFVKALYIYSILATLVLVLNTSNTLHIHNLGNYLPSYCSFLC